MKHEELKEALDEINRRLARLERLVDGHSSSQFDEEIGYLMGRTQDLDSEIASLAKEIEENK
jgi:uncharacterized protein YukE